MSEASDPALLTVHAVRLLGYADTPRIADRFGLPPAVAEEHLLDAQASGRITYTSFGGEGGWSMTEAGRRHSETLLSDELDRAGGRGEVERVHDRFGPHNATVTELCSAWQLAGLGTGEPGVDLGSVVAGLGAAAAALAGFEATLTSRLDRFAGYHVRFAGALDRAGTDPAWLVGTDRDSCHRVWFELHEDLIATLGLSR